MITRVESPQQVPVEFCLSIQLAVTKFRGEIPFRAIYNVIDWSYTIIWPIRKPRFRTISPFISLEDYTLLLAELCFLIIFDDADGMAIFTKISKITKKYLELKNEIQREKQT